LRVAGSAQEATKPERFGRYVLLDRIGMGGMAEVYRAVMPGAQGFRRTFVVKRILGQLSQSESFVEMFVREARICGLLNHPSIVQVYDFGNVDGSYFLAMEYVRGRDLQAVLRRARQSQRPLPVSIAAFVAREVAECLGYAHSLTGDGGKPLNVIHRDVSPSNIMCLSAGGVKLLDFGIAKTLGEDPSDRTERGAFKGKLSYMAPERIRREPIDGRSDLFSLGVVLWEMLAGRRLFRGNADVDTLQNVLEAEVPRPSSLRPDVSPELDAIAMRALERDPAKRYPTGQAMAEELEEVLHATKYNSKMLPNLLRDLFGTGLHSGQIQLSADLLDPTPGTGHSGTGRSDGFAPTAVAAGSVVALAADGSPLSFEQTATRVRLFRRVSVAAFAVSATAVLGVLLFGRGFGGSSHATTLPAAVVAAVAPKPEPQPSRAGPASVPAVTGEAPVAGPSAAVPVALPAAPRESDARDGEVTSRKHSNRSRSRAERDRIARGLSIDPFAEAHRRSGR
jgi:serine/threonine protein kinase